MAWVNRCTRPDFEEAPPFHYEDCKNTENGSRGPLYVNEKVQFGEWYAYSSGLFNSSQPVRKTYRKFLYVCWCSSFPLSIVSFFLFLFFLSLKWKKKNVHLSRFTTDDKEYVLEKYTEMKLDDKRMVEAWRDARIAMVKKVWLLVCVDVLVGREYFIEMSHSSIA